VARRNRGQGSQVRAEGRVRGRVQERVRGRAQRGGGEAGRKRNTLGLGDIEGYANRLAKHSRGTSGSGLAGAAPGLAGAASALAGGGFASRFMESGTQGSEEDFRKEVVEHFTLIEERLKRLEEQVLREQGGTEGDPAQPEEETSPDQG
jgi:hypothetical protein